MRERDERWENIQAVIKPRELTPEELEAGIDAEGWLAVVFTLDYNGAHFWSRYLIHKDDLKDAKFNLLGWFLDKVVERMDEELDRVFGS